eukprot:TRINITY_DN3352_c3_g1_i1.p1 TRINITY_DN3352_c3_g1~~TRINITY_DN3352_c3_g1_i1.p1  ORF type:complete len:585 (+),score=88.09 TRINITY_DN3352_c3_g1_i1:126-1880(+)
MLWDFEVYALEAAAADGAWTSCCSRPARKALPAQPRQSSQGSSSWWNEESFVLEVQTAGAESWRLDGTVGQHKVSEVKERLATLDVRFRTHRADLVLGSKILGDQDTLARCGVGRGDVLAAVFSDLQASILVIGGGTAGRAALSELSSALKDEWIVLVEPKGYFEHGCGILRAFVDPTTWGSIVLPFEELVARYPNVVFVQGKVTSLRAGSATAVSSKTEHEFLVRFRHCLVATGCDYTVRTIRPSGQSHSQAPWRPQIYCRRKESRDELWLEDRRHRILEEHSTLKQIADAGGSVLVVGADYPGVEWACDLKHYFPNLCVTLIDSSPRCLANFPALASEHAELHMRKQDIRFFFDIEYQPDDLDFWAQICLHDIADITYLLQGCTPRTTFMPQATVSELGPNGGGWILVNEYLQVCSRLGNDQPGQAFGEGCIFAVGDCQYSAIQSSPGRSNKVKTGIEGFIVPPVPKTALSAVSWSQLACRNIIALKHGSASLHAAGFPNEAGIVAVSLGPEDGVVVWKVKWFRNSGEVVLLGESAAKLKQRLTWPSEKQWLVNPNVWLETVKANLPLQKVYLQRFSSDRPW